MGSSSPIFLTSSSFIGALHGHTTHTNKTCSPFASLCYGLAKFRSGLPLRLTTSARTDKLPVPADPILEGDLVAYRQRTSQTWSVGAVVEIPSAEQYQVRSLCSRSPAEDETLECFVDWEPDTSAFAIAPHTHEITLIDADYEERVVQDRLANPHGEVSEDCWRISTQLLKSLKVIIPRT